MEVAKQSQTAPPTPEQLLKLLELQIEGERVKRAGKARNRATFLVAGILAIIVAAGIALVVAEQMVEELRQRGEMETLATQAMGE